MEVINLVNLKSKAYKNLNVDAEQLSPGEIAKLLSEQPRAMIRPLLTDGKKLVTGFNTGEMESII